jgi:mannan endo-1,4-beta-mannosidase
MTKTLLRRLLVLWMATAASGCDDPAEQMPDIPEAPLPPPPPLPCAPLPPIGGPLRRNGSALVLEGAPFRALGANLYYLQQMFAYDELGMHGSAAAARAALDATVCLSMNVVRLWAFNDTTDSSSIRRAPGLYSPAGLRGLDRAVAEAKGRGIRVILTLVNGADDYGGLKAYASWANPGDEPMPETFFLNPVMRQYWKDYASLLLERVNTVTGIAYRDEPAILAWEIGNELRCRSCAGTSHWRDTIRELAAFLRAAGATQLIADGSDGFDDRTDEYRGLSNQYPVSGIEGTSFTSLLGVEELDMVSYHVYPDRLGVNPGQDIAIWIAAHQDEARRAGKVAYAGEFGFLPASLAGRDRSRAEVFGRWLDRLYGPGGGALALLWQVEPPERLIYDDGYGVVFEHDPLTAGQLFSWGRKLIPGNNVGGQP